MEKNLDKKKEQFEIPEDKWVYMRILEDYAEKSSWQDWKIGRDLYQNFFDANNYTLDGVTTDIVDNDDGSHTLLISAEAEYDFRRLTQLGGGYKRDKDTAAGGFHEGAKMVAFFALRDHNIDTITYGSGNWKLDFDLKQLEETDKQTTPEDKQNLKAFYAHVTKEKYIKGNYVKITSEYRNVLEEFAKGKNFFVSSENPDIQPKERAGGKDQVIKFGKKGKIIVLPPKQMGALYFNGMKIHVDREEYGIPGLTIVSSGTPKNLNISRDRESIHHWQIEELLIPHMVEDLTLDNAELALMSLEDFFDKKNRGEPQTLISALVNKLKGVRNVDFDPKYYAADVEDKYINQFSGLFSVLCHRELADVGMQRASEAIEEVVEMREILPSPEEEKKIVMLHEIAKDLFGNPEAMMQFQRHLFAQHNRTGNITFDEDLLKKVYQRISPKNVKLFIGNSPSLRGSAEKGMDHIWIEKNTLGGDMPNAMATIIHENCHEIGDDYSASFGYMLTTMLKILGDRMKEIALNPTSEQSRKWAKWFQQWDQVSVPEKWTFVHLDDIVSSKEDLIDSEYQWKYIKYDEKKGLEEYMRKKGYKDAKKSVKAFREFYFENILNNNVVIEHQKIAQMIGNEESEYKQKTELARLRNDVEEALRDIFILLPSAQEAIKNAQKDTATLNDEQFITLINTIEKQLAVDPNDKKAMKSFREKYKNDLPEAKQSAIEVQKMIRQMLDDYMQFKTAYEEGDIYQQYEKSLKKMHFYFIDHGYHINLMPLINAEAIGLYLIQSIIDRFDSFQSPDAAANEASQAIETALDIAKQSRNRVHGTINLHKVIINVLADLRNMIASSQSHHRDTYIAIAQAMYMTFLEKQ